MTIVTTETRKALMTRLRPVTIDQKLLPRIGVREWGLPSLIIPGQIWRSKEHKTITCMLPRGKDKVRVQTRPLTIADEGDVSWMPMIWRKAIWQYVQAWPSSGCGLGAFIAISNRERHEFLLKLAKDLLSTDEIGSRMIAHDMGMFAAFEFELAGHE